MTLLSRRVLRLETDETDAGNELYTISNLGGVLWDLVGCNALTWVLLFLCMFRGVKSRSGSFQGHFKVHSGVNFRVISGSLEVTFWV